MRGRHHSVTPGDVWRRRLVRRLTSGVGTAVLVAAGAVVVPSVIAAGPADALSSTGVAKLIPEASTTPTGALPAPQQGSLTVTKQVSSRMLPGDQFTVTVRTDAMTLGSVTTGGGQTSASIPAITTGVGESYWITDTMADGWPLPTGYTSTITCTDKAGNPVSTVYSGMSTYMRTTGTWVWTWAWRMTVAGATDYACIVTNSAPVKQVVTAQDDTASTSALIPVTTDVLANDTSNSLATPLDPGSVTVTAGPDRGKTSINSTDGAITYTPGAGFSGVDTYQYNVCNKGKAPLACDTATVTVTVANVFITATDDAAQTSPSTPVTTDVAANDKSGTGQPLAAPTVQTPPAHGKAVVAAGKITYTPDANWSGTDSYVYQICDTSTPKHVCATATVTIEVPNTITGGASITTRHDTAVTTLLSDIAKTTGAPLDPAKITSTAPIAQHGSIVINRTTSAVTYTPTDTYTGPDSYGVNVCEASTPNPLCKSFTVHVTVGANTITAVDDSADTAPGEPVTTDVLGNDTTGSAKTPLDLTSVGTQNVTHGVTAVDKLTGKITFTPNPRWSGVTTYSYRVCDTSTPEVMCDDATVTVTVANLFTDGHTSITTPQNKPITTELDQLVTTSGSPVNPTSVTLTSGPPPHGSITIDSKTGAVTYTPTAGYTGPDGYTINVCDTSTPEAECHDIDVTIAVGPNAVTVQDFSVITRAGQATGALDVLSSATSKSGQPLGDPAVKDSPKHGTASLGSNNTITYRPAAGFEGTDSFTYTVCDTGMPQACATGTVTVTVTVPAYPVEGGGQPSSRASTSATGGSGSGSGALANTGTHTRSLVRLGWTLLAAGAFALFLGRRRRTSR
jgi:hypothetical protein